MSPTIAIVTSTAFTKFHLLLLSRSIKFCENLKFSVTIIIIVVFKEELIATKHHKPDATQCG